MKLIFMGTPEFSVPALDALAERHEIVCVYTQPPRPAGRGKAERKSPVHLRAEELSLEVRHPARLRDAASQAEFAALGADVAVVVAYGLILPLPILAAPRFGCLNIHASLLPRWRGAAPIHRAIMAGDSESGVCIMQMDEGLDTGPVLMRAAEPITASDTTADLHDRLSLLGARLIVETLAQLNVLVAEPQDEAGITYAAKIDKAEARIDWTGPAVEVDRKIRGLSPFPGAWTMVAGERIKFLRSQCVPAQGAPGEVLADFTVACGSGAVRITEAQREGKRPMKASEILRGLQLPPRLA